MAENYGERILRTLGPRGDITAHEAADSFDEIDQRLDALAERLATLEELRIFAEQEAIKMRLKKLEDQINKAWMEKQIKCCDDPLPYETTEGESGCARCHTVYQEAAAAPAKNAVRCRRCGKIAEPSTYLREHWYCPRCDYTFAMTNTAEQASDEKYWRDWQARKADYRALQERHERLVDFAGALLVASEELRAALLPLHFDSKVHRRIDQWLERADALRALLSQEPKP